ncbi:MAG: hypothetical protein P4L36_13175 [Holophaga sp.]|nr:hypothetical protein [Holophaga sp.]
MNLDEFGALALSLWTDQDRAAAFQGLALGCSAGPCPTDAPDAFRRAWELGATWRQKAEGFRITRKKGGLASAAAREGKFGTAQPGRKDAEHVFEQPKSDESEHVFDGPENPNTCSMDVRPVFGLTSNLSIKPEEKIKRGLVHGIPDEGREPVPAPPEPAPSLDSRHPAPAQVSPTVDLDDYDGIPLAQAHPVNGARR